MNIIISFKSRNQTIQCYNMLRSNGYKSSVVDTPLELHGSCSLSVKSTYDGYVFISSYLRNYPAFQGAYKSENENYTRIF